MEEFKEGQKVYVSFATIYNNFGENLTYGKINKVYQEGTDTEYFDFYNADGELSSMDGEVCKVVSQDKNSVVLLNTDGKKDMYFKLSKVEFIIGIFY